MPTQLAFMYALYCIRYVYLQYFSCVVFWSSNRIKSCSEGEQLVDVERGGRMRVRMRTVAVEVIQRPLTFLTLPSGSLMGTSSSRIHESHDIPRSMRCA